MNSGVHLSFSDLASFSPAVRTEIGDFIRARIRDDQTDDTYQPAPDQGEEPPDLTVAQVQKFLERVSDKVRKAMRAIAASEATGFTVAAVAQALDLDPDTTDLRGVWGGITKRVRTVTGEDEVYLIWWTEHDEKWIGRVSEATHRAMRIAFGL